MTAFLVFICIVAAFAALVFVANYLERKSKKSYPLWNAYDPYGKPERFTTKHATKQEPLYIVSKTFKEADAWRKAHRWHRDYTFWVSGPGGLADVREATVVFTGDWQDRTDAPRLWAQAHAGSDINILIDGAPEAEVDAITREHLEELLEKDS